MLTAIRAILTAHWKAAQDSLQILRRQPVASLMTMMSIASILTLPAIFLVLAENVKQLTETWQNDGAIILYLKPALTPEMETRHLADIQKMALVKEATLKSASQGLKELSQQEGMQNLMQDLSENPLPAVIEVIPTLDVNTDTKRQAFYAQLQQLPFVDQVKADTEWMTRVDAILHFLSKMIRGLIILFAGAVVFIIANTLRQAVYSRHEEIQVLKLIGAKDAYILRPFLYSGVFYGLLSALLATFFIYIFSRLFSAAVSTLSSAFETDYVLSSLSAQHIVWLMVCAIGLGWLGACLSVKGQLTSIEPFD